MALPAEAGGNASLAEYEDDDVADWYSAPNASDDGGFRLDIDSLYNDLTQSESEANGSGLPIGFGDEWLNRFALGPGSKINSKHGSADTLFEFVTEGILLTSVSLFGLVGNMVAIVVLSRPSMRGSFSTLLIGEQTPLVFVDTCLSLSEGGDWYSLLDVSSTYTRYWPFSRSRPLFVYVPYGLPSLVEIR